MRGYEHHIFGGFMKKLMMLPSAIYELPFNIEVSFFLFFQVRENEMETKVNSCFFALYNDIESHLLIHN